MLDVEKKVNNAITSLEKRAASFLPLIRSSSVKYGLPDKLLLAVLDVESSFLPSVITGKQKSVTGAVGIAQFLPSTAADEMGLTQSAADKAKAAAAVTNPTLAIPMAANYLAKLRKHKNVTNWEEAVVAYNQGAGNVGKAKTKAQKQGGNWLEYIAPEGQQYLAKIKKRLGSDFA